MSPTEESKDLIKSGAELLTLDDIGRCSVRAVAACVSSISLHPLTKN